MKGRREVKQFLILLVLVGCTTVGFETQAVLLPSDFGGIPGDGLDDRLAIQAAIDDACVLAPATMYLADGQWDITTAPPGSYNHFAGITIKCENIDVVGQSRLGTVLRLQGDMLHSTTNVLQVLPGAGNNQFSEFTINTTGTYNDDEQSRALLFGGNTCAGAACTNPIEHIKVENVNIIHPLPLDGSRKGDCIGTFGESVHVLRDATFIGLDLLDCARSGIAGQRFGDDIQIIGVYFEGNHIGGGMYDGEASGTGGQHGLQIESCIFNRTDPGGDNYALAMTTQYDFQVTGNLFRGRGMNGYRLYSGAITNNVFDTTDLLSSVSVVDLGNEVTDVVFDNNSAHRRGGTGSVLKVRPTPGNFATGLTIGGNALRSDTDGAVVHLDSAQVVAMSGNTLIGNGSINSIGVYVQASSRDARGTAVVGNVAKSFGYAAFRLDPGPFRLLATTLTANIVLDGGPWLRCDDATTLWNPGSLTLLGNATDGAGAAICAVP